MSDCLCKHVCILCVESKNFQPRCPCRTCLIRAICETKCNAWLIHWAKIRYKSKKYKRGERYV
jgi:hypothetical protein